MPKSDSQEPTSSDMEKLFLDILPEIPIAVRKACRNLGHHSDQIEFDGLVQRIILLLLDNDFHTLRSFNNGSQPQTWLFTIARRYILLRLREHGRMVSLDDMPFDSFTVQPDQEEWLLSKEREEMLQAIVCKLTKREQELFSLWRQGSSVAEMAEQMNVKKRSASVMKRALVKKLQRLIKEK
ncbi:MAG: sigma-70 family RNA polymerase sigma factor [Blastocatellales bacterium]